MHFHFFDQLKKLFISCLFVFGFKVLTACAEAPKTVEILFNSYTLVPVTYKWVEAIPEDTFLVSLFIISPGSLDSYRWNLCVNMIYSIIISNIL